MLKPTARAGGLEVLLETRGSTFKSSDEIVAKLDTDSHPLRLELPQDLSLFF
jgi:hypothetical protein